MKKFLLVLLFFLLVFLGLTYWSVAVQPEDVKLSEVVRPAEGKLASRDSVNVITSNLYTSNRVKRFMQGQNYRRAWAAEITAPVFHLDSMKILEEGGGQQTHSLDIKTPGGVIYSLRSVNKDPEPLIPDIAYKLGLENIVVDGISAQHPYGALLAAALAEPAGIFHTHPRVVFLPRQTDLKNYNEAYGDKLYLLEYETEGKVNWTPLKNIVEIVDTDDLQKMKLVHGKKLRIDQAAFVRARIFDLLIGDWDRHAKQWGWIMQERGDSLVGIPLPGDRDNAFFRIDGVIPTVLTNALVQPLVRPFEEDIDYIQGYVYPIDVYLLQSVPKEVFVTQAQYLQSTLSDQQIRKAFKAWPPALVDLNGQEISRKLKGRRDELVEYALEFKKAIDQRPLLEAPLKGSEDLNLPPNLQKCFDCLP